MANDPAATGLGSGLGHRQSSTAQRGAAVRGHQRERHAAGYLAIHHLPFGTNTRAERRILLHHIFYLHNGGAESLQGPRNYFTSSLYHHLNTGSCCLFSSHQWFLARELLYTFRSLSHSRRWMHLGLEAGTPSVTLRRLLGGDHLLYLIAPTTIHCTCLYVFSGYDTNGNKATLFTSDRTLSHLPRCGDPRDGRWMAHTVQIRYGSHTHTHLPGVWAWGSLYAASLPKPAGACKLSSIVASRLGGKGVQVCCPASDVRDPGQASNKEGD